MEYPKLSTGLSAFRFKSSLVVACLALTPACEGLQFSEKSKTVIHRTIQFTEYSSPTARYSRVPASNTVP
jgi:hypothetical protein